MIRSEPKHEMLLARCWPALLIGTAWVWIFWPMMSGQTVVGFRDSAYLYYPLFKWIDAQWAAGVIPLWNPYCNFGMPVVADGSSSVFYPGKLVFFCRFLSYPARYGIYLAIHIPLAAAGCYWFARTLRANRTGATLAAFSFAFGGSVLFQVTNVIFLVSAAWLPFALCCVWKMVKTGETRWAVGTGVCCALMILGGDPQMVYHVGLIAVATIGREFLRRRQRYSKTTKSTRSAMVATSTPARWLFALGLKLAILILVTSLLSAVQLLPTYVWAQHSERSQPGQPVNVYSALKLLWQDETVSDRRFPGNVNDERQLEDQVYENLLGPPVGVTDHAYQFSQAPWTVGELFWPNVSGKPFPRHQRWTNAFPGSDRVWVPSIYCGVIVLMLGAMGIRLWGRRRRQVWLTRVMLFFGFASLGWYGGVWLINELFSSPPQLSSLGPQVGGIYWAMNVLLPKYFVFRYPAKLFVIASLALSLMAGIKLRGLNKEQCLRLLLVAFVFSSTALGVWLVCFALKFVPIPGDPLFGPFDDQSAIHGLQMSLLQPVICLLIVWGIARLLRLSAHCTAANNRRWLIVVVVVTVLDVIVANQWLVPQVDVSVFEHETLVNRKLDELKSRQPDAAPVVIWRNRTVPLEPGIWMEQPSNNRLSEIVTWQRESLYPKHHLGKDVILLGSFSSIWPTSYEEFLQAYERRLESEPINEGSELPFHGFIASGKNQAELIPCVPADTYNPPTPICWLGELETDLELDPDEEPVFNSRVTEFTANRFVARVSTNRPRELTFCRIADAGWTATIRNLADDKTWKAKVKVDLEFEMLFLDFDQPGEFEVEFVYRPIEFWVGAWVSGCSWGILFLGIVVINIRKRISFRLRRIRTRAPGRAGLLIL